MAQENILSISLREYKKQIDELKGSLLSLDKESDEYKNTVEEISNRQKKLEEVMKVTSGAASASTNSMAAMKDQLKEWKKEANTLDVSSNRFKELSEKILNTTNSLKDLEAAQGTFSRNVGNYASATDELKSLQKQMADLLSKGVKPTDEGFVNLAKRAGDLKDAISDAKAITSQYAADTKTLNTVLDVTKNLGAAYGVLQGAMSIFGGESQRLQENMVKLQAIMTTVNSLSQIQTALFDSESATSRLLHSALEALGLIKAKNIAVTTEQTAVNTAETASTTELTGAIAAETTATGAATIATNLFKKALLATGIGAFVVLVGTLVAHLNDLVDSTKKAANVLGDLTGLWHIETEEEKKAAEEAKKAEEEKAKAIEAAQKRIEDATRDAAKSIFDVGEQLKVSEQQWKTASTEFSKTKALESAKDAFNKLGIECNSVKDAQRLLVEYGPTVQEIIRLQGEEAAIAALKVEAFSNAFKANFSLVKNTTEDVGKAVQQALNLTSSDVNVKALGDAQAEITNRVNDLIGKLPKTVSSATSSTKSALEKSAKDVSYYVKTVSETATDAEIKQADEVKAYAEKISKSIKEIIASASFSSEQLELQKKTLQAQGNLTLEEENRISQEILDINISKNEQLSKIYEEALTNQKATGTIHTEWERELANASATRILEIEQKKAEQREYIIKTSYEKEKKLHEENVAALKAPESSTENLNVYVESLIGLTPAAQEAMMKFYGLDEETQMLIQSKLEEVGNNMLNFDISIEEQEHEHQEAMIAEQQRYLDELLKIFSPEDNIVIEAQKLLNEMKEQEEARHVDAMIRISQHLLDSEKRDAKGRLKIAKADVKDQVKAYTELASSMGSLMGNISDIMKQNLDQKVKNGEISEEEAKKEFERIKKMQIAEAIVNTLSGAVGAYMNAVSTYEPPFGPILGGINAAAATAMGLAQIAQIKNQQYGSNSNPTSPSVDAGTVAQGVDMNQVAVNPLLDENRDIAAMGQLTPQGDQRVYILQSDLEESGKQVQVRQNESTF